MSTDNNTPRMGPGKQISYLILLFCMPVVGALAAYQLFQSPNEIEALRYWGALIMAICLFLTVFTPKKLVKIVRIAVLVIGILGMLTIFTPYSESLFFVGMVTMFASNMVARIHDVE